MDKTVVLLEYDEQVDLKHFEKFVREWSEASPPLSLQDWDYFKDRPETLTQINEALELVASSGCNLWEHEADDPWAFRVTDGPIDELRLLFLRRLAPLASATQHCERNVKLCNFVTSTGRGSTLGSCYVLSGNKFESCHDETKARMAAKKEAKVALLATQQESQGNRSDGQVKKAERVRDPRGSEKGVNIIKRAKEQSALQHRIMTKLGKDVYDAERARLFRLLDTEENANNIANDNLVEEFRARYNEAPKPENKKQRRRGVDYTAAARGRFDFKDLRKAQHEECLRG